MISATQASFEVAQNRIDPVEFWQILRLATVRDDYPVLAACISNPGKTAQSIGSNYTIWREISVSSVGNRFACKTRNGAILIYRGRPSALSEMAATKDTLFAEPRPALLLPAKVSIIRLDITT